MPPATIGAKKKLEFSLVQRYLEKLSTGLDPDLWANAIKRVETGDGVKGVALDMLREADLL